MKLHIVMRENFDGIYVFRHADQAAAFAALLPDHEYVCAGELTVLNRDAAERLIDELSD